MALIYIFSLFSGCSDPLAINYKWYSIKRTQCFYHGCMDKTSKNYNKIYDVDDGSCIFTKHDLNKKCFLTQDNVCLKKGCLNKNDPFFDEHANYPDESLCLLK